MDNWCVKKGRGGKKDKENLKGHRNEARKEPGKEPGTRMGRARESGRGSDRKMQGKRERKHQNKGENEAGKRQKLSREVAQKDPGKGSRKKTGKEAVYEAGKETVEEAGITRERMRRVKEQATMSWCEPHATCFCSYPQSMRDLGHSRPCHSVRARHQVAHLAVVGRLFDDLGGHPERCAYKGTLLVERTGELTCHAKVCQFDVTLLRQQHVGRC